MYSYKSDVVGYSIQKVITSKKLLRNFKLLKFKLFLLNYMFNNSIYKKNIQSPFFFKLRCL